MNQTKRKTSCIFSYTIFNSKILAGAAIASSLIMAGICQSTNPALSANKDSYKHLPTIIRHQEPFKEASTKGITFAHPSNWKTKANDDEDTLIKLAGSIISGATGEMTISRHKGEKIPAKDLKLLIDRFYLKNVAGVKIVQEEKVNFGRSRNLQGIIEDVRFDVNGTPIYQRLVFFEGPDATYSLSFIAPYNQMKELTPVFNRILLSFAFDGKATSQPKVAAQRENANLKAKYAPVSLTYPVSWEVKENTGDNPLTIEGKNADGKPASINVYQGKMHPYWTIEQVASALEKEHLIPREKYRKLNETSRTFGTVSRIHGIVQESQFEIQGTPIKQMAAYFQDGNKAYMLSMTSSSWKASEMRQAFYKVLSSLGLNNEGN